MSDVVINFPPVPLGVRNAIDTVAELRALDSTEVDEFTEVLVAAMGFYRFDPSSLGTDNGTSIIKPDDLTSLQAGRWLIVLLSNASLTGYLSPQASALSRSVASIFDDRISVMDSIPANMHASMRDGTNTTPLQTYIQNAINAAGEFTTIEFPGNTRFYMTAGVRMASNRQTILCGGMWSTIFQFEPTAAGAVFHFERAADVADNVSSLDQCSFIGGCTFTSNDTAHAKVAIRAVNVSAFKVRDISYIDWHTASGGNSVIVQTRGREWIDIENLVGGCDLAVHVQKNGRVYNTPPDAASTIDFDHSRIARIYLVNTSTVASLTKNSGGGSRGVKPGILIDSGVNLTTSSIDSCALALGTDGIVWWDETATQVSSNLDIRKVRFEQGTSGGTGYAILIRRGYDLAGLFIDQCEFGTDRGVYLNMVQRGWIRDCDYPGASVGILSTAADLNYLLEIDGGSIDPAALSLTNYYMVLGVGAISGTVMGLRRYVYDRRLANADTDLALRRGGTKAITFTGSLAAAASYNLNIGTNNGVVLARYSVTWGGATKRGIGYASLATAGGVVIGAGSDTDFAVTNAASHFCLHTAATMTLTNNLAETVSFIVTVDFI